MDKNIKLAQLEAKKVAAQNNAKRQERKITRGLNVKVQPSFWWNVARDYQREIDEITSSSI